MNERNNPKLTSNAQTLRTNMTKEEKHLWYDFLKKLPCNVNRQKVIGTYIVDFYIARHKIVIELDGAQHYLGQASEKDKKRDNDLRKMGITVLRYSNQEVNNKFNAVCQDILNHLGL